MQQIDSKNTTIGKSLERRQFMHDSDKSLESYMPKIAVMGIGGAGNNATNLLKSRLGDKVDFFVCNTDVQSLQSSTCENKIILGMKITKGQGAGAKPSVGRAAAEDTVEEIIDVLKFKGIDMLIITGGEGGGTGTGAMPVIAKAAREEGILTIGVVTKPFSFEGLHRMAVAEQGIRELQDEVDTLVVIANDNLRSLTNGAVSFKKAFEISDTFLSDCVMSFVSIIQEIGLVNIDFADLCSVARDRKSRAIMGTGYAEGENCGARAIEEAMSSLLLDFADVKWDSVCNVLVCVHGSEDLSIDDVGDINEIVKSKIAPTANIITGTTLREDMKNSVRVFVFGTTNSKPNAQPEPKATKSRSTNDMRNADYEDTRKTKRVFVGTKHDLHEDVSEYTESITQYSYTGTPEKPKRKGGFLSRLWGGNQDEEEVIQKDFIPEFFKKDEDELE